MERLKSNLNLSKKESQSLGLITWCLILSLLYQTFHMSVVLRYMVLVDIFIIIVGLLGCAVFLSNHSLKGYPKCFLWLIFYFIIVGSMYGDRILSGANLNIILSQDLKYVMLFLMGGIFAYNSDTMTYFHRLMKWLAIISIVFGILGLISFNYVESVIAEREGTWTLSYYYWWASCACFSYWGYYALFVKKNRVLGLGVLLVYLVLGALFVKRAAIVNGVVMMAVYILLNRKNIASSFLRGALVTISFIAMLYVITPSLFSGVKETYTSRFEEVEDMESFNRNQEAYSYFDQASTIQLIFGNGIGHYPKLVVKNYTYQRSDQINALHSGWANVIYKGGFLYALFYIAMLIAVIREFFNNRKLNSYQLVCLGVSISSFVSMLYEGSWTYTIISVCTSAPLFYLLSNNKNEIA